jgi:hypothetical protein
MTKTKPHPLCDMSEPWGVIRFIHFRDGSERKFYTMSNNMTGSRMTAFDDDPPDIDDPMPWIKSVFRDIRKKATKVLNYEGTKHFQ